MLSVHVAFSCNVDLDCETSALSARPSSSRGNSEHIAKGACVVSAVSVRMLEDAPRREGRGRVGLEGRRGGEVQDAGRGSGRRDERMSEDAHGYN